MRSEGYAQFGKKIGRYKFDLEPSGIGLDVGFDDNVTASRTPLGEFGLERHPCRS